MNKQEILNKYIEHCSQNLKENNKVISILKNQGIYESFIFDNFNIGFASGDIMDMIGNNAEVLDLFINIGLIKNNKEIFYNNIVIPIYDENRTIVNIAFYNPYPQSKNKLQFLNDKGIFNSHFLKNNKEVILTLNPIDTFLLIQKDYPNATFLFGQNNKYIEHLQSHGINKTIFTFDGKATLFYELTKLGISSRRIQIDFDELQNTNNRAICVVCKFFYINSLASI